MLALAAATLLGCWTARSETTNAALTFYVVSEEKIENGRFIDTPALPKVGYIRSSPDLIITNLQDVYVQKMADHSVMYDTNGHPTVVPRHPSPSLSVQLEPKDAKRFAALTERALNKRLLVMFGDKPLTAPWVRARIERGSFVIGFESEAELKKTQYDLLELIR